MDYINNRIYISVVYDKYFQNLKTNKIIFTIQQIGTKYFIADIYGKKDREFSLVNESDFDFTQKHFCKVEIINPKNNYASIEIYLINDIKIGIDKLYLKSNKNTNEIMFMMETLDGTKAILLAISQVSNKKEKITIIDPKSGIGYYIEEVFETNEKTNFFKKRYLEIKNKIGKFNTDDYAFVLFSGNIGINEEIQYMTYQDSYAIDNFSRDITNYVNLWNKYNDIERHMTFQALKNQESVTFSSYNISQRVVLYFDEENYKKVKAIFNNVLIIGNLQVKNLFKVSSFSEYITLEKYLINNEAITYGTVEFHNDYDQSVEINVKNISIIQNLKTEYGYIATSLQGSAIMFKRREEAKKRILTPKLGHLDLKSLFTDDPIPAGPKDEITINHNLIKDLKLTENQKLAIEIICNTPDIAIIQGPPGTGKTTVINQAIIQINEHVKGLSKKTANNLISGFRHETVNNLADRVRLYGLPTIKIGTKYNEDEALEPKIDHYIDELNDRLEKKYQNLVFEDNDFDEFSKLYSNYVLFYNSIDSTIDLLRKIKSLEMFKFRSDVNKRVDELIYSLEKKDITRNYEKLMFLELLYELPLYEEAYKDSELRVNLKLQMLTDTENKELNEDIKTIIKAIEIKPIDFIQLKNIRRDLIIKHRELPKIFTSTYQKKSVIDFLNELHESTKIERLKKYNGEKLAILEYKESLKENPFLVRQTLLEYTKVLGASNQQSISENMAQASSHSANGIGFDNVFIDEAATSSPLDLFIPMTLAKERVVLVGDHKQLPHIINDDITDKIKEELEKENKIINNLSEEFETTLFEYLINKAHMLERKDGRRRVITLNNQFRMHPALGDIVSRHFYQDEGGLNSPRPATDFKHDYHNLKDKYLHWIENKDVNQFEKGSRYNINESELIVKHIKQAVDNNTYHHESIAIISFYRAQIDKIKTACIKYGLFDAEGNPIDKLDLSIGTVDAFQGREFNIVYLASTYSVGEKDKNPFGNCRLNDRNLLCVALSRQKNLLIVVGNPKDYRHINASKFVSSLYEINKLCNG